MIGVRWDEVVTVWRKELLDILRDRRTIMAMIVVPLLVYPVLILGISQLGLRQVQKIRESVATVTIQPPGAAQALQSAFLADSSFILVTVPDPEDALDERELDAILQVSPDFDGKLDEGEIPEVVVLVDLSRDRGREIRDRVEMFLNDWERGLIARRLAAEDLPESFLNPVSVTVENVAGARKMGGSLLGQVLPILLVVMMMTGALYPAIDVTAGERERGTLETLLVSPGSRFSIVLGKYLTVFVASMVTTLANLISIAFTIFYLLGSANLGETMGTNLPDLVDWRAFFLVFLIMIPLALFFCGLAMVVASFARSFKEAQNYLSPLLIACIAPAYLGLIPGFELSYEIALIPIANVVLLSRELLLGNYPWQYIAVTLATMTGFAILMLQQTVAQFGGEAMLGGAEGGRRPSFRALFRRDPSRRSESLSPGVVAQVFALVLLGFFYLGGPLQIADVRLGLVFTQLVVIAGFPLIAMRLLEVPIVSTLRLGVPKPQTLLFALLLTPAATLLAAIAAHLQGAGIEVPDSYRELMRRLIAADTGSDLLIAVLVFAAIPGICEELLFRGFVLRGLAQRMSPRAAVVFSAILFGAFHFDLYRLLPTTLLGIILGWVAWRTGRLWPAMVLHVANNAIAVLAMNLPALRDVAWLQEGGAIPAPVLLGGFALGAVGALGIWVSGRGREASGAPSPALPSRDS